MPEVSVIVPVYKVEQYLPRCIDSILAQTFTDFELILVDDGSPDRCGAICDEYAARDNRICVIHKENGGVSAARNVGVKCASGEWLTFCDSDDWYAPEWLSKLLIAMRAHNADMVIGDFFRVCESIPQERQFRHRTGVYSTATFDEKISYIYTQLFGGEHGWEIWTHLFRSCIVKENGIQFCETCGNFAEDLGFVLEYILYANRVVSIDYMGYYYFLRYNSMMRSSAGEGKCDAHNEISLRFLALCGQLFDPEQLRNTVPIVHFLIMLCAYNRVRGTEQYRNLHTELTKMKQYNAWKKLTKQIFGCRKELERRFGQFNARRVMLLSHYCLHGNWKRFSIESALFYRFNKHT